MTTERHLSEDGKEKSLVQDVPTDVLLDIGWVFAFGARKYARNQWRDLPTTPQDRVGSALRHIYKWLDGVALDDESSLHHIDHAITQLMMAKHYINKEKGND